MVDYLIVSISSRALASSARQAAYNICIADCYTDEDTRGMAESFFQLDYEENGFNLTPLKKYLQNLVSLNPDIKIVVGSGFELNPEQIIELNDYIPVISNSKETIDLIIKPRRFFGLLDKHAIRYPDVSYTRPANIEGYLSKFVGSVGGLHVNWAAKTGKKLKREFYYQKYISGVVYSAVFLANGNETKIVGFNRQLQSKDFLNTPFLYQGAINLKESEVENKQEIEEIVNTITKETNLKGLCGIDYIVDENNEVYVLEINPRPPSTFELHEVKGSLFDNHLSCFKDNRIEQTQKVTDSSKLRGYVILYAKQDWLIHKGINWPSWVKDKPKENQKITVSSPVCTIHAEENTVDKVKGILFNRLHEIESIVQAAKDVN